ncbi:MAG: glutamine-hydrolyzing GMP synthase [Candidatus Woesearchaeota archaeon]|jgi:GMP synthase (glutamine-hydrolysing)|nr:glutamine-hydrolyzing GMP synthase [Candidatus Woesearchaeota archaeon]
MILVINYGGQYCHLIARRVRDLGVYSEVVPYDVSIGEIQKLNPNGIIFSGGPSSVYEKNAPKSNKEILTLNIPILGICYGQQLIAKQLGAKVESKKIKEYGKKIAKIQSKKSLLKKLKGKEQVWMSHGDSVSKLPENYKILASTETCKIASFGNDKKKIYGVQFHPEVVHTPKGNQILKNFIFNICKAKKDYNIKDLSRRTINEIKEEVQDDLVIMGTSGGVDSTVAAVLAHKAIGDHLHCIFVDHGLIRKNEAKEVKSIYKDNFNFKHFYMVDASKLFLKKLRGVTDPEKKRKIIGHTFIEVFEKKAKEISKRHKNVKFLGQGTIYPDRIESAQPTSQASKIKSHHNLTLPEKMDLKIIEPLKELYKDGVRALGSELNIPRNLLYRHPFPGPGLAIRILGEITDKRIDILREADHIYMQELKRTGQYQKIWQAFAALLPVKTVGVMGDARTYEYVISLRAVTSKDAMTADWAKIPNHILEKISNRIINEVNGVNRVVYDITQKPPGTIEYE